MRLALAILGAQLGLAAVASGAASRSAVAPGRVTFSAGVSAVGEQALALPNGGAVVFADPADKQTGLYAAQLNADGSFDQSFGNGGLTHVPVSAPFTVQQIARQPDGKLVIAGYGPGAATRFPPLALVRLNPNGSLDRGFGDGGVAILPIDTRYCAGCTPLALTASGELIVTGSAGRQRTPGTDCPTGRCWVLARLTSTGALDPTFGQSGIVALPGDRGSSVVVLPSGEILAIDFAPQVPHARHLTRLLASGAPDPTFNKGTPVNLPDQAGVQLLAIPGGSVVIAVREALIRYTGSGAPDPSFGPGGIAPASSASEADLLPSGDGALLATASVAKRITASGAVDRSLGDPKFLHIDDEFDRSFQPTGHILRRPNGSYLVFGIVGVEPPITAGAGAVITRKPDLDLAVAALTPSFARDTSFGGPAARLHATIAVPSQRATTVRRQRAIRVKLTLSAPGNCAVVIKTDGGHVLARSVLPDFSDCATTTWVELTAYGDRWLRRHPVTRLHATARAIDLLANTALAKATAGLR